MNDAGAASPEAASAPRGRRWGRVIGAALVVAALAASPWWGRAALQRLDFFQVRRVEIRGVHHLPPSDVVARLAVDTTASVWMDLDPLARRVAAHPLVADARVSRRLPGTLVVEVTEKVPVALVPSRGGFRPFDARGTALPIDPSKASLPVDLPILAGRDTALLRLLGELREREPALFARVSEVRRAGRQELVVRLSTVPVRAAADVRVERLADIIPVEQDLARRRARVVELDLRYREQVIARLE